MILEHCRILSQGLELCLKVTDQSRYSDVIGHYRDYDISISGGKLTIYIIISGI